LDLEHNDDFYLKKLRLNPSKEAPPVGFKWALEKWIQNGTSKDNVTEAILLDTHYKYDKVKNMGGMLDVVNKEFCASFFIDNVTRIIVIVCTTHRTKDVMTI
jgi:hypothetical protein